MRGAERTAKPLHFLGQKNKLPPNEGSCNLGEKERNVTGKKKKKKPERLTSEGVTSAGGKKGVWSGQVKKILEEGTPLDVRARSRRDYPLDSERSSRPRERLKPRGVRQG